MTKTFAEHRKEALADPVRRKRIQCEKEAVRTTVRQTAASESRQATRSDGQVTHPND